MKIKNGFYTKEIGGLNIVVSIGDKTKEQMNSMIKLNESATCLWKRLQQESSKQDLVKTLTDTYDVTGEIASNCVDRFIEKLDKIGCIDL